MNPSFQVMVGGFWTLTASPPYAVSGGPEVRVQVLPYQEMVSPSVGIVSRASFGDRREIVVAAAGGVSLFHCCYMSTHGTPLGAEAELGVALPLEPGLGVSPRLGLTGIGGFPATGPVTWAGYDWNLGGPETWEGVRWAGGANVLPVWIEGRPLRVGADGLLLPAVRAAVAPERARFVEEGRAEWASVASFLRLARELADLGAPKPLVGRALAAAREEVGHAAACFALAEVPVTVGPLPVPRRHFPDRRAWLRALAHESFVDGVLGEGDAAGRAEAEASATRDDRVACAKARIASEERGHAALAEDVLAWCRSDSGWTNRDETRASCPAVGPCAAPTAR